MVAGWGLAVFGSVLIAVGLTISSGVHPKTLSEDPSVEVSDGISSAPALSANIE